MIMIIIYTIVSFWIALTLWIVISYLIFRNKYHDKKTGFKKCGVCGKTPSTIYYRDGFIRRYHCLEHSKELNNINK